jgi:hypothetical protein
LTLFVTSNLEKHNPMQQTNQTKLIAKSPWPPLYQNNVNAFYLDVFFFIETIFFCLGRTYLQFIEAIKIEWIFYAGYVERFRVKTLNTKVRA